MWKGNLLIYTEKRLIFYNIYLILYHAYIWCYFREDEIFIGFLSCFKMPNENLPTWLPNNVQCALFEQRLQLTFIYTSFIHSLSQQTFMQNLHSVRHWPSPVEYLLMKNTPYYLKEPNKSNRGELHFRRLGSSHLYHEGVPLLDF